MLRIKQHAETIEKAESRCQSESPKSHQVTTLLCSTLSSSFTMPLDLDRAFLLTCSKAVIGLLRRDSSCYTDCDILQRERLQLWLDLIPWLS